MPYEFYKLLHFTGIFMIIISLGGMTLHILNGGTRQYPTRRFTALTHGIGMALVLVAGFGLMAKLSVPTPWPGWIYGKLLVWLTYGLLPAFVYRKSAMAKVFWFTIIVLGMVAAYLATNKPF